MTFKSSTNLLKLCYTYYIDLLHRCGGHSGPRRQLSSNERTSKAKRARKMRGRNEPRRQHSSDKCVSKAGGRGVREPAVDHAASARNTEISHFTLPARTDKFRVWRESGQKRTAHNTRSPGPDFSLLSDNSKSHSTLSHLSKRRE